MNTRRKVHQLIAISMLAVASFFFEARAANGQPSDPLCPQSGHDCEAEAGTCENGCYQAFGTGNQQFADCAADCRGQQESCQKARDCMNCSNDYSCGPYGYCDYNTCRY